MEDATSAPLLQLHAHPGRIVDRPARRKYDLRNGVEVFGNLVQARCHRGVPPLSVQLYGQLAGLPRAEAVRSKCVAEDETPRPIEVEDGRFLRAGREAE